MVACIRCLPRWQPLGWWDVARYRVECALGAYSVDNLVRWDSLDPLDRRALALVLPQHPDVWSDGSKVTNEVAHIDSASARGVARISGDAWNRRVWALGFSYF